MALSEAVIYCRASKDRTGSGLSVGGQERDCRTFAATNKFKVRRVYTDNDISASGRKPRPAYRQMLKDLADHPSTVVVWHTDRLHRHPAELEEYISLAEKHGIITRAVRVGELDLATPSGRLVARMLGAAAKHELELMSQRRKDGKARAAASGTWKGGRRPFGYKSDGVTLVPEEAALIVAGTKAILAGQSLMSVTRAWRDSGIPTSTGRHWEHAEVRRVLVRARNAGLMAHQGAILEGVRAEWPPVVEESLWRGVVAALSDPGRRTTPGPARRWLLSGIAVCGVCGSGLIVSKVAGKGRTPRPVYRCRPKGPRHGGTHAARAVDTLDEYVTAAVLARLARPDAEDLLRPEPTGSGGEAIRLQTQLAALRQRLDQAADMFAQGELDARQVAIVTSTLNTNIAGVTHKLAELWQQDSLAVFADHEDPAEVWARLDLRQRQEVIKVLLEIVVHPAPKGRPAGWRPGQPYFTPESVELNWRH